jgi:hypothetical protein
MCATLISIGQKRNLVAARPILILRLLNRQQEVDMMRVYLIATLPLLAGCIHGDAGVPIVSMTRLPGTQYSIYLHGPNFAEYFYTIESPNGDCGLRKLGEVAVDESIPPRLEDLGNGVFRVTWGKEPHTVFAIIDTAQRLFVGDSNKSNPANQPFETPRYLRPEYANP